MAMFESSNDILTDESGKPASFKEVMHSRLVF